MSVKSFFYHLNLFIRSFIYSMVMTVGIFIYSFIVLLAFPFSLRIRYSIVISFTSFMIWFLKILCHINYEVEGLENIPKDRAGIVLSKHQSAWETFYLPSIFFEAAIILKHELLWLPFFGWGLRSVEPIAIDRNNKATAMEQIITKGKKCLEQGRWILIFPEGTRVAPGTVGTYRLGGPRLAVRTGAPIIPVAHNAGRYWPRRKFIKKPGTIRVVIGPLIESKGRKPEELLVQAKTWIESTMLRIDGSNQASSAPMKE